MTPENYFFDYPLVDVNAIACSALRVIYHDSAHGAFGSLGAKVEKSKAIDLDRIEAFKVSLKHISSVPLSREYEYSLVYLNRELSEHVWKGSKRADSKDLKKLTRRVHFGEKASLEAKRYRTPFWVRFLRPIYIAKCETQVYMDYYVPQEYHSKFHAKFDGFLMRNKVGYPLVRTLFEAHGLKLDGRREVKDSKHRGVQVLSYQV